MTHEGMTPAVNGGLELIPTTDWNWPLAELGHVSARRYVVRGVAGGYQIWDNRPSRWWVTNTRSSLTTWSPNSTAKRTTRASLREDSSERGRRCVKRERYAAEQLTAAEPDALLAR
jgi:hypothetical protein